MEQNPKEVVNVIELVDSFITTLNNECVKHKVPKVYELKLINGATQEASPRKCKTLRFTVADTNTNERLTILGLDYPFNNPAELLSHPYKRHLYREFLYNCVGITAFNLEANVKHKEREKRIKEVELLASQPVTPDEAFMPTMSVTKDTE